MRQRSETHSLVFPFLFGGTFIEGYRRLYRLRPCSSVFPFLFGGTFIEGCHADWHAYHPLNFPSFSEGLSLRERRPHRSYPSRRRISLPFRRDFH